MLIFSNYTDIIYHKKQNPEKYKKKFTAIGHAIISATRPRSFNSSLLLANGVYLHHKFETREMIDIFSQLGFSASYNDVKVFERSASCSEDRVYDTTFSQYIFDNADFSAATLDGLHTMHVMGGVRSLTPSDPVRPQKRIDKCLEVSMQSPTSQIPVHLFDGQFGSGLQRIKFSPLDELFANFERDAESSSLADVLWMCGKSFKISIGGWNGFLQNLTENMSYEKSAVTYLPFLDLPPNNYDCIYSVLMPAREKTRETQ